MTSIAKKDPIIRLFDVDSVTKKMLVMFVLLLPFQHLLKSFSGLNKILRKSIAYSDELSTLLLIAILFTFIALKPKVYRFRILEIPITKPFSWFILVACLSMVWNSVPILQAMFGIYDFTKSILVFYVFATLRWHRDEFISFIFWIKVVILILAIIGLVGQILVIAGFDPGLVVRTAGEHKKRLGLDRVVSLTGTGGVNYLGMYSLLGLFLFYGTTKNKVKRYLGMIITVTLIFMTFSRQTWMGLFAMMVLTKRKLILPGILIVAGIAVMTLPSIGRYNPELYYRSFTYMQALNIFIDHPVIGAGPGMFGGLASVMFNSPYYDDWPNFFRGMMFRLGSLDAFWPAVFAELGFLGFWTYYLMWSALHQRIVKLSNWFKFNNDLDLYNIGTILKNYLVALVIMCFFTGLNKPFVIYTFFALCGIYLSLFYQYSELTGTSKSIWNPKSIAEKNILPAPASGLISG